MEAVIYPEKESWDGLCKRPVLKNANLDKPVKEILQKVKISGDSALYEYSKELDRVSLDRLKVTESELREAESAIKPSLKRAIDVARKNIEKFHKAQIPVDEVIETMPGVKCWRKNIPVEKVGLYIPGGTAPLFSTVLMLGIPAKIAGCKQIILCTPPDSNGNINPAVLYTARLIGITEIFKAGGAQAIAAMAYGTESVPKIQKIFGPGNQYVMKAKEMIRSEGTAIDIPAGPSEVLVIADSSADPEFVAADLLSQAEHGPDSQVILVTETNELISDVKDELDKQLRLLPRASIAAYALNNSLAVLLKSLDECMEFSNLYAPEHLIINTKNASRYAAKVVNAGSVFIGKYSCESAGDYASGPNHTLPTNGYAATRSGVSVDSFVKKVTFQELTHEGISNLGEVIQTMAEAEMLQGHSNAVNVRLKK